jgi:bacterial/archaeal transporter family-2 protein
MSGLALSVLLAIGAGVSIVVQQVLNSNLRTALNSAAWSGFVSYLVGVVCMALLALALRDSLPAASVAVRIPWWAWSGGLFGAIFIGLAILLVPRLGAATFIALLVTGQMLASVAFARITRMRRHFADRRCRFC